MKHKLLKTMLLLSALVVGLGTAWADEYSYTFSAKQFSSNGSATLGGVSWTLAGDGGYWGYDETKGQQFGSGGSPYTNLTLTTSDFTNVISAITVNASTANSATATISCTVDGGAFGTQNQSLTNSAANYTFSGSALGVVVISISQSTSKALYIKSITVTYTSGKVETFSYEDYQGEGTKDSGSEYTMWGIDVSITNNKFYGSTVNPCAYFYGYAAVGTGTTTITPHNGATITKVEIMTYDTDHNGWQVIGTEAPGEITASVGTITANNEDKTKATKTTWTGSASEQFTITNTRTIAWSSIKVYYTGGLPKCATPVISGDTPFATYTTVSIACATLGASIQYSTSTDGVNYTAYQPYTGPFQISESKTVKAQATKEGMVPSDEAYKGFVQEVTPNIGYFISSHKTTPFAAPEYVRLEDALVTYKNGTTAYIEDAYSAIMLYQCVGDDLAAGDKINGFMKVTGYNVYQNLPEITGFELVDGYVKTSEPEVNPTVVTLDQLLTGDEANPYEMYLSKYVKIENATVTSAFASKNCTIEQGGQTIILRDQNKEATLTSTVGDNVTVTGFVAIFGTTKQIAVYEQSQIVVTAAPPTIVATPSSLTGFTYGVGNGPSAAQTITVSGKGLTDNITLTKSNDNYEISLTEGSGYTNSLTLTPTAGTVAATTVYVRLKAGLPINASYSGSIAITSTGATSKTVTLSGSVETPYITWDLSQASYDASPTEELIQWSSVVATMKNERNGGSNTAVNNYIPTENTSTRFYKSNKLTVTPATGYAVMKVVFEATTEGYASALASSAWTNASAKVNVKTVTVTPKDPLTAWSAVIGGTCGFTSVSVYYEEATAVPSITLSSNSIEALTAGGGGTITVTYHNIKDVVADIVWYTDEKATATTTEPDWISAEINASNNVEYLIDANTGAARTAYMKVYALDDELNDVYSPLITITQAEYVDPASIASVTLDFTTNDWGISVNPTKTVDATQFTSGGYTITLEGSSGNGYYFDTDNVMLGKSGATLTLPAFDFNVSKIKVYGAEGASGSVTFNIFVGENAVSTAATSSKVNHEFAIATDKQAAGTIYVIKVTNANNMRISKIEVFGYVPVTVGEAGYTTFWTTNAKTKGLSYAGVTAYVVTAFTTSNVTLAEITEAPAWTPVIIEATEGVHNLAVIPSASPVATNQLQASRGTNTAGESIDFDYYALGNKSHGIGFYKVADGVTIPDGKAFLMVPVGTSVKEYLPFDFGDGADGINSLTPALSEGEGAIYNVAGQRLQKMQKGINIVNGKKILK